MVLAAQRMSLARFGTHFQLLWYPGRGNMDLKVGAQKQENHQPMKTKPSFERKNGFLNELKRKGSNLSRSPLARLSERPPPFLPLKRRATPLAKQCTTLAFPPSTTSSLVALSGALTRDELEGEERTSRSPFHFNSFKKHHHCLLKTKNVFLMVNGVIFHLVKQP